MKSFDAIIGHKKIISHFEEAIKTGKVSHAYLLSGEDGSGKMMMDVENVQHVSRWIH